MGEDQGDRGCQGAWEPMLVLIMSVIACFQNGSLFVGAFILCLI